MTTSRRGEPTRERRTIDSLRLVSGGRFAPLEASGSWSAADVYYYGPSFGMTPAQTWGSADVLLWSSSGGLLAIAAVANTRSMAGALDPTGRIGGIIVSARGRESDLWRVEVRHVGAAAEASEACLSLETWQEGPPCCSDRATSAQAQPDTKGSPGVLEDFDLLASGPCILWTARVATLLPGPGYWLQLHDTGTPLVGGETPLASEAVNAAGGATMDFQARGCGVIHGLTLALSTRPESYVAVLPAPIAYFFGTFARLIYV